MTKKKEPPKPLFGIKHDFYESLDHVLLQAINLMQAVDQVLDLDLVKEGPGKDLLKQRGKLLREALMTDN